VVSTICVGVPSPQCTLSIIYADAGIMDVANLIGSGVQPESGVADIDKDGVAIVTVVDTELKHRMVSVRRSIGVKVPRDVYI